MLHYMFAVKNDSETFANFKAKFKNNVFQRDDLNVKLMIDPLPSFGIEGKPKMGLGYDVVCMIITPQIVNTSMLGQALNHAELFNKHFKEEGIAIIERFILVMDDKVAATPVHHISTFGDEFSILKNMGRVLVKHRALLELVIENKYKLVRSCALNPTHLKIGRAILDLLKVAVLEFKANGVTPSISDMIINGYLYDFLECLPEEARMFFIKLISHAYIALNYIATNKERKDYTNFVISTIEDFKFPDHGHNSVLAE